MTTPTLLKQNRLSITFDRAHDYVNEGEIEKAIEKYVEAAKLIERADKARVDFGWGRTFMGIGEYDKAIKRFAKVIGCSNSDDTKAYSYSGRAYFNLGLAYSRKGDWHEAMQCFEDAVRINPNDFEARRLLDVTCDRTYERQ